MNSNTSKDPKSNQSSSVNSQKTAPDHKAGPNPAQKDAPRTGNVKPGSVKK